MTREEAEAEARLTGEPVEVWSVPTRGAPRCERCYVKQHAVFVVPDGRAMCREHARGWKYPIRYRYMENRGEMGDGDEDV